MNDNKTRQQICQFLHFIACQINVNTFVLGSPGKKRLLHDQAIEEKEKVAGDVINSNNEPDNTKTGILNLTDFHLLKQNSMAIYYGWQLVCLIIFIFTAYETMQTV